MIRPNIFILTYSYPFRKSKKSFPTRTLITCFSRKTTINFQLTHWQNALCSAKQQNHFQLVHWYNALCSASQQNHFQPEGQQHPFRSVIQLNHFQPKGQQNPLLIDSKLLSTPKFRTVGLTQTVLRVSINTSIYRRERGQPEDLPYSEPRRLWSRRRPPICDSICLFCN